MIIKKMITPKFDKPILMIYSSDGDYDMAPGEIVYEGEQTYKVNEDRTFDTSREISQLIQEHQKDCAKIAVQDENGNFLVSEGVVGDRMMN